VPEILKTISDSVDRVVSKPRDDPAREGRLRQKIKMTLERLAPSIFNFTTELSRLAALVSASGSGGSLKGMVEVKPECSLSWLSSVIKKMILVVERLSPLVFNLKMG
jgi:hypothetical protein